MSRPFPAPSNEPFERLQPNDGMLITAEHWKKQENFHRRCNKFYSQSLNQPGIVNGLGVRAIAAPKEVSAAYRDQRWVQIQPGSAVDLGGNIIVVPKPVNFRITTQLKNSQSVTVYLVARYRDPDDLEDGKTSEIVQEQFRIDEKSTPPDPHLGDVELCRILCQINKNAITEPTDVFFPGYGEIDLRERVAFKPCPEGIVRVAFVNHSDPMSSQNFYNISYLLQAVEVLDPSLRGVEDVERVDWAANLRSYDLLYLTGQQKLSLNALEFAALKSYLHSGGTLLVDVPSEATELIESVQSLAAKQLKSPLKPLEQLRYDHPIRKCRFLFGALPLINQQRIQLLSSEGLVLTIGDLASAWGLERGLDLPRTTIREAQELGVNILRYAWKRRQLTNLYQEDWTGLNSSTLG